MDNKILNTIIDKFKGSSWPATAVSESTETIEEVYEPFLFKKDLL
jgi:Holliday junction DNA helicase RuvB